MRKAFDANVPKLKPRLKANAPAPAAELLPLEEAGAAPQEEDGSSAPTLAPSQPERGVPGAGAAPSGGSSTAVEAPFPARAATPIHAPAAIRPARPERGAGEARAEPKVGRPVPVATSTPGPATDVLDRKDRLEKIKRKVAEAARPVPRPRAAPADPARAAESVLGLVHDLEEELVHAREREDALRADLDELRKELGRTVSDGRTAAERLSSAEKELEEKRAVLAEMLEEMQALEDERDESVRRAQALASLDEERARLLEEITRRAEEEAKLRAEREAEVERLSEELRAGAQDGARLRAAVGELARERDQLAAEVEGLRKERDDLAAAKRALEQVHAALAQARARLG